MKAEHPKGDLKTTLEALRAVYPYGCRCVVDRRGGCALEIDECDLCRLTEDLLEAMLANPKAIEAIALLRAWGEARAHYERHRDEHRVYKAYDAVAKLADELAVTMGEKKE